MVKQYFKILKKFKPEKDYGVEIRPQYAECLSLLKVGQKINQKDFAKEFGHKFTEKNTRNYVKDFDEGTKRIRTEQTITDKVPLVELLQDMEKHAK